MALMTIFLLAYSFSLSSGYTLMDEDLTEESLTLASEYYLQGEKIDLIRDFKEPIELWYSSEYNRSRIDVRGGMVKRYYYFNYDDSNEGKVYTISPRPGNLMGCSMKNITDEDQNHPAFPTEEYVYAGNEQHEGKQVDVWEYTYEGEEVKEENVMYTYRTERGVDVPVQIVQKKFDTMRGMLDSHYIYNYFKYNPIICAEDLDAEKDMICDVTPDDFHKTLETLHPVMDGDLDIAFNSFKGHHNKKYRNNEEHRRRKEIFHRNWRLVVDYNSKNLGFKLAVNQFADHSPAELRHMYRARSSAQPLGTLPFPHSDEELEEIVTKLPKEYDMRLEGLISPIKDQGLCGSCWAFGTTAGVEGALARIDGRILDLSEQSLLDCSWNDPEGNSGCEGGFSKEALQHVMKHGLPLDEDYGGYLGEDGYCHLEEASQLFKIKGFTLATPLSASAVKVALFKYGPVIVSMQANDAFSFYSSGVFYDHTCVKDEINHIVTIVGYGVRDGVNYWIVKNSYGQQWGESGYMLLSAHNNNCFVLNEPYYAVA